MILKRGLERKTGEIKSFLKFTCGIEWEDQNYIHSFIIFHPGPAQKWILIDNFRMSDFDQAHVYLYDQIAQDNYSSSFSRPTTKNI